MDSTIINLGGRRLTIERARLGLFLRLSRWVIKARDAISRNDSGAFAQSLAGYAKENVADTNIDEVPGIDIAIACAQLQGLNQLTISIPLLRSIGSTPDKRYPWDYDDRMLVTWVHLLASSYHWSLDAIHQLWPDDAVMFVQEILIDDQMRREWEYSLSQVAYKYDKRGKGELVPLKRPGWMLASGGPPKSKILKKLLPVGNIIDLSGFSDEKRNIGVSVSGTEADGSV